MISQIVSITLLIISAILTIDFYKSSKCSFLFYKNSFRQITRNLHNSPINRNWFFLCSKLITVKKNKNTYQATNLNNSQKIRLKINGTLSNDH